LNPKKEKKKPNILPSSQSLQKAESAGDWNQDQRGGARAQQSWITRRELFTCWSLTLLLKLLPTNPSFAVQRFQNK
jgi:hypothetical protein